MRNRTTARTAELKEAIIASFKSDARAAKLDFARFDDADWASVLWWLDISGMAIYFLHRACQIGVEGSLPGKIKETLESRLENNRRRTQALREESSALATLFEDAGIPYALLKGFTLAPESVPEVALRSQADLDFLVGSGDAELAVRCAAALEYKHSATFGNTMELRAGVASRPDMARIYSVPTLRSLEIHLLPEDSPESNLLTRRVGRSFDGLSIYALSPADIMVQQAAHLLKHLCGEQTRLSWVLEFWRHAAARASDARFWTEAEERAKETVNGDLAMGIAFRVAGSFFGDSGACIPERWRSDAIPLRVRMWIDRYARPLIVTDRIGNKLYALLRAEIGCAPHEQKKTRDILLPRVLPFRILEPRPQEGIADRFDRYSVELSFFLRRLEFHIRESMRLAVEIKRWNRATAKAERMMTHPSNSGQGCPPEHRDVLGGFKSTSGIAGGHGD